MAISTIEWIKLFMTYVGWWLIPLIVIFGYRIRLNKFPIGVTIFEKRGENNFVYTNDVCGRFNNPVVCYKLKKNRDTIPIPKYDWILQSMYKPTNIFEKLSNMLSGKIGHIVLFKYGSKQYKPVNVKMADGTEKKEWKLVTDKNGSPTLIQIYEPINSMHAMSKLDFEVIDWDDMNHMTQELRAIATRRSPLMGFIEKHGALIAMVLAILALIIVGYYYKEMMIDAGSKIISSANTAKNTIEGGGNTPATTPNIPIVGDLFNPK